jgi:hypothetical protein
MTKLETGTSTAGIIDDAQSRTDELGAVKVGKQSYARVRVRSAKCALRQDYRARAREARMKGNGETRTTSPAGLKRGGLTPFMHWHQDKPGCCVKANVL